jgi:hypothetical protein
MQASLCKSYFLHVGVGLGWARTEDGSGRGLCCGEMRQRAGLGRLKEGAAEGAAAQSNVGSGEPAGAGDQRYVKGWSDMVHKITNTSAIDR